MRYYAWNRKEKKYETNSHGFPDAATLCEQARKVVVGREERLRKKIVVPRETRLALKTLSEPLDKIIGYVKDGLIRFEHPQNFNGYGSRMSGKIDGETVTKFTGEFDQKDDKGLRL